VMSKASHSLGRRIINTSADLDPPTFLKYWKSAGRWTSVVQVGMQGLASC